MTDQGPRDPNQEQRTTTVETTTTGPGDSEYARPGRVETTITGPGNSEYARPGRVETTTRPSDGDYARPGRVETSGPSNGELARRITVFVFGIIQALIILRIVLFLLDARETNGLVSGILNVSQVFVAPFDGILHTNAMNSGGSVLDLAAIVALVGWTILEGLVIAGLAIFRREPA